ncbi:DUF1769 family protein [Pseudohyphozyma bogoriensis]|nr:DUF1769 family protein [Pseudohyphozyma bogoriensis]
MKLKVLVGPSRFEQEIAWVNNISKPTIIDTPSFAGRVMVYVRDFVGVTPDGSPPTKECSYFDGRSRKFAILIEGRFKHRDGVEPYSGDEIHFGSDFDFLPASFPHGPFNAGMRIAKMVDPATYYEEHPPHGRPYIMSPYAACMNTFCAYPAPSALSRAVLLAHHDHENPHHENELKDGNLDFVPVEETKGKKRVARNHWRFLGLKGDPRVDAFVASHAHLLSAAPPPTTGRPRSNTLGTTAKSPSLPLPNATSSNTGTGINTPTGEHVDPTMANSARFWGGIPSDGKGGNGSGINTPVKKASGSRFSLATLTRALGGDSGAEELHEGDLVTGDMLNLASTAAGGSGSPDAVESELGPWRYGEDGVDALEDTAFVFLDPEHTRSVAQRRKWFVSEGGKHRKEFKYDPEVVYTASFFTPFCDLNTFDLKMGPVSLNIAQHFTEMPIRYTLRSTRLAPRPDGKDGPMEEECFATIAFQLVDE